MYVKGDRTERNVEINITNEECIKSLYKELGFKLDYFIKDNKICRWEDIGYHKSEIKEFLVTDDIEKVKQLKALELIKKSLKCHNLY